MNIVPPLLKKNDLVEIVATARAIQHKDIELAIAHLEAWGLRVKVSENIGQAYGQLAGRDVFRAKSLQEAIDNPEVKAIFCARGGYGTIRIADLVNFEALGTNPKWIIGYSDVTVLHSICESRLKMASIHSEMPLLYPEDKTHTSINSLQKLLFYGSVGVQFPKHELNQIGNVQAPVVGGNLSVLYSLLGSKDFPDTKGKILFLEDLDEYLYHIDRMMVAMKRAGVFAGIKGLLVGGMSKMRDNAIPFGKTAEEIVIDVCKDLDVPIAFNFPAGHIDKNHAFVLGVTYELNVQGTNSVLLPR